MSGSKKKIAEYLNQQATLDLLKFITCGSVDDGKSTFTFILTFIFQISAVADALKLIFMINNTFLEGILFIISLFITFTPLLGPVLGIIGATFVWNWNILLLPTPAINS